MGANVHVVGFTLEGLLAAASVPVVRQLEALHALADLDGVKPGPRQAMGGSLLRQQWRLFDAWHCGATTADAARGAGARAAAVRGAGVV